MQENGLPEDTILDNLNKMLKSDLSYESGRILGSMCTKPNDFALEVYQKYAHKNLGDPGLFPGTMGLEKDLVDDIGTLMHGENITGSIVTGGSEANIIAMHIARKLHPNVKHPEIICSANAHMSFYKAADLMGFKINIAKLNENYLPDMQHYKSLINENTIALVGIAGTTSLGHVEPIEKIGKLAESNNLYVHVDAAFGGFVLPFMEELGHKYPKYDFRVPQVDSITADPHKMGMGLIPGGGLFIRENTVLDKFGFSIPYLAGGNFKHLSLTGTRSGASAISFWALMKKMGMKGFRKVVNDCWDNTQYLVKRIQEIDGIEIASKPSINIVGIRSSIDLKESICKLDKELRNLGWALGIFKNINVARIVCMPHIKREHLDDLAIDLEKVVKKIKSKHGF